MRNIENLAYFTEAMRQTYSMAKTEKGKAIEALSRFLKATSLSDLEKITQDSKRGVEVQALKTNPAFIDVFVESIDTTVGFERWISAYSRSWRMLN